MLLKAPFGHSTHFQSFTSALVPVVSACIPVGHDNGACFARQLEIVLLSTGWYFPDGQAAQPESSWVLLVYGPVYMPRGHGANAGNCLYLHVVIIPTTLTCDGARGKRVVLVVPPALPPLAS